VQFERLGLHSHILPLLREANDGWLGNASVAEIFDCRAVPWPFIFDAGEAAFEEAEATGAKIRLPYTNCYFEFDDETSILAVEFDQLAGGEMVELDDGRDVGVIGDTYSLGHTVTMVPYLYWSRWTGPEMFDDFYPEGEFPNGIRRIDEDPPPFFCSCNAADGSKEEGALTLAAKRLVGVLSLLNDKLLTSERVPDPAPKLSKARERRGALPITAATHVLRVNVAAVRQAARAAALGVHESPCLHWRRGHWRVLHRGSEFEGKAWVRKCLVGDPSKGFIGKQYRLVREPALFGGVEIGHSN
jgi:hypothetical protein